jgi:hypothetical protein
MDNLEYDVSTMAAEPSYINDLDNREEQEGDEEG